MLMLTIGPAITWGREGIALNRENYKINPEVRNWLKHQLSSTASMIDSRGAALHHFHDLLNGEKDEEQPGTEGWPRINIKLFKPVFDRVLREIPGTDPEGKASFS
jgi:hypothetical protein